VPIPIAKASTRPAKNVGIGFPLSQRTESRSTCRFKRDSCGRGGRLGEKSYDQPLSPVCSANSNDIRVGSRVPGQCGMFSFVADKSSVTPLCCPNRSTPGSSATRKLSRNGILGSFSDHHWAFSGIPAIDRSEPPMRTEVRFFIKKRDGRWRAKLASPPQVRARVRLCFAEAVGKMRPLLPATRPYR
jgi:hypothetical protein